MASIDELLASARTDTEKIDRLLFMLKNRDLVIAEQEEHIRRLTADRERADREAYNARQDRETALRYAVESIGRWSERTLGAHQECVLDTAREFEQYLTTPTTEEGPTA